MRRRILPFDIWVCLALAFLVSLGTGKLAGMAAEKAYEAQVEAHKPVAGEVGGPAGEEAFQVQDVKDLLSHDTFTVISPGIQYRNRGAGYYGGRYFQALTLPSGERVAAWINEESVRMLNGDDYYTTDKRLPLGRVVYEDLTSSENFLEQIQHSEPLSRTDFYVDMVGDTAVLNEEQATETPALMVQLATIVIVMPLLHMLGAKLGIFPAYFVLKKNKKSLWD